MSRIRCLKEGDNNTFFFHKVALRRRRINYITPSMFSLPEDLGRDKVINHISLVFQQRSKFCSSMQVVGWDVDFSSLSPGEAELFEGPFLEEEIYRTLMEVDGNKALGLDGFLFRFAESFWQLFKKELFKLVQTFHFIADFDHIFS